MDNAARWKGREWRGNEKAERSPPTELGEAPVKVGWGLESWEAESFTTLTTLSTAMAGVGGWKVHREVLPMGQLVFSYIFVFRERAGPSGPLGS